MKTNLDNILKNIQYKKAFNTENNLNMEVKGVSFNSKAIDKNDIFVCIPGEKVDGHDFARQAIEKGASAVVSQKQLNISETPIIQVENTKLALAEISTLLYNCPAKELEIIGVTGTNGKTTVTHLIESIFEKAQIECALIGTLGSRLSTSDIYIDTGHTTPQAPDLQKTLREIASKNIKKVVMEVSSHALEQHRVTGCNYKGGVFTNLTQDHLDYHVTMDNYFRAKSKLFESLSVKNSYAIINKDDPYADKFIKVIPEGVRTITYGINNNADLEAVNIEYSTSGARFILRTSTEEKPVKLKMAGQFSIYNALAALGVSMAEGIDIDTGISALESTPCVAGRFEVVSGEPLLIVDYAHTPDGLENVLKAAKEIVPENGELICLFGCGGDRDVTKRPIMGQIAESLSDRIVITSDNPRTEDPQQIITDILSGIQSLNSENVVVEIDREVAIEIAVKMAKPEDVLVIAGKGHEDYQIIGESKIHFDDREEARKALSKLSKI